MGRPAWRLTTAPHPVTIHAPPSPERACASSPPALALLVPALGFGLGLSACSDYSFKPAGKPNPGADSGLSGDGGADSGDPNSCSDRTIPGESVALNDACYVEYTVGSFTPVVEWRKSTWSVDPSSSSVMMMPAVASLTDDNGDGLINQDDVPDIIVVTYGGVGTLRAVSGDGSREIFNVTGQNLQMTGAVAVGDIDGDGIVEIAACTATQVKVFENDGTLKWTSSSLAGHMNGTSDAPSIADMDGDGHPEVIVGNAILNADGSVKGLGSFGQGGVTGNVGTASVAVDLDGDGIQELVTGNAVYRADGSVVWHNSEADGYVAVADFDGDGQGEIVSMNSGTVRLTDTDGTVLWRATIAGASSGFGGPPTVADFDGDGEPEIGVAGRSNYTVFDTDGTKLWERTTQDGSSGNTGSAVFDFEGDGVAEAVYADETRLWVFNGPDGAVKLESADHSNATWTEYSVIADVDGDGHAEIVVPNTPYTASFTGITVIGDADNSWKEGRRIWNQHAYSITNINDDGTIPAHPAQNWLTYNNFRSGDLSAGQNGEYPDLVVRIADVCLKDCDHEQLKVWLRVGNQGYLAAEDGVEMALWAVTDSERIELYRETLASIIDSGQMLDSIQVDVDLSILHDYNIIDLEAAIDGADEGTGTGRYPECDETNNVAFWGENLCKG